MIEQGNYGVVRIIKGKLSGRLGDYDDDDGEENKAIVYLDGETIGSSEYRMTHGWPDPGYFLVPYSAMRPVTLEEQQEWAALHQKIEFELHRLADAETAAEKMLLREGVVRQ